MLVKKSRTILYANANACVFTDGVPIMVAAEWYCSLVFELERRDIDMGTSDEEIHPRVIPLVDFHVEDLRVAWPSGGATEVSPRHIRCDPRRRSTVSVVPNRVSSK